MQLLQVSPLSWMDHLLIEHEEHMWPIKVPGVGMCLRLWRGAMVAWNVLPNIVKDPWLQRAKMPCVADSASPKTSICSSPLEHTAIIPKTAWGSTNGYQTLMKVP